MKRLHYFLPAFALGFASCAVLMAVTKSFWFDVDSNTSNESRELLITAEPRANPATTGTTAEQNSQRFSATLSSTTPSVAGDQATGNFSESDYWLQKLLEYQHTGTTEQVVEALMNYSDFELDAQQLNAVIESFKVNWLHNINQFLNNTERLDIERVNSQELQRYIDRLQKLTDALPGDAEIFWLLSRLYRLAGDDVEADYYAVLAGSDPRYYEKVKAQQQLDAQEAQKENVANKSSAPIEAPLMIPLIRHQSHFLVSAQISGWPVRLLIDTGASLSGITHTFAMSHSNILNNQRSILLDTAAGRTSAVMFTAETLAFGDLLFRNHPSVVIPTSDESGFDGILGLDILGRFDFYIDQPNAELHLRYRLK